MSEALELMKAKTDVKVEIQKSKAETQLEKIAGLSTFDWKAVPPPVLASVLVQIPFRGKDADYYLAPWQAAIWSMRCYELGLSPFSNETWFNPKNNKVNLTLEGKLSLARKNGWKIGAPQFVEERSDKNVLISVTCKLPVYVEGEKQFVEYKANMAEWAVGSSPVWREKGEHMLRLRSYEKALSWVTGIGASELPDEPDIAEAPVQATASPVIPAQKLDFVQPNKSTKGEK